MKYEEFKKKYKGVEAEKYEDRRREKKLWENEQKLVEKHLKNLASQNSVSSVLDIPVGTGRFIEAYKNLQMKVTGIDISEDMIAKAREKVSKDDSNIELRKGDVKKLGKMI